MHVYRFHLMVVDFAFCIESREDENMPETVAGCLTMNHIDVSKASIFEPTPAVTC